jgi:hypothetical protein
VPVVVGLPQVGLVDQRGRLQGLSRLLLRHLLSRDLAQLIVHQRQKLLRRLRVAMLHAGQDLGDLGHGFNNNEKKTMSAATDPALDPEERLILGRPILRDHKVTFFDDATFQTDFSDEFYKPVNQVLASLGPGSVIRLYLQTGYEGTSSTGEIAYHWWERDQQQPNGTQWYVWTPFPDDTEDYRNPDNMVALTQADRAYLFTRSLQDFTRIWYRTGLPWTNWQTLDGGPSGAPGLITRIAKLTPTP